jgi:hypothetical protein
MKKSIGFVSVTSVLLAAGAFTFVALADNDEPITFSFDVAQDGSTYKQNNGLETMGQDTFSRGDTGIVDGTIYRAGTLLPGTPNNDPKTPGIGTYRWRATYAGNSADFDRLRAGQAGAAPVSAFATEMFSLPDDGSTLLTDGVWPNPHFTLRRVVLGGTGQFRNLVGEMIEQNIGENKTGFCNLRVTFRGTRVSGQHAR